MHPTGSVMLKFPFSLERKFKVQMFSIYGDWHVEVPAGTRAITVAYKKAAAGSPGADIM